MLSRRCNALEGHLAIKRLSAEKAPIVRRGPCVAVHPLEVTSTHDPWKYVFPALLWKSRQLNPGYLSLLPEVNFHEVVYVKSHFHDIALSLLGKAMLKTLSMYLSLE